MWYGFDSVRVVKSKNPGKSRTRVAILFRSRGETTVGLRRPSQPLGRAEASLLIPQQSSESNAAHSKLQAPEPPSSRSSCAAAKYRHRCRQTRSCSLEIRSNTDARSQAVSPKENGRKEEAIADQKSFSENRELRFVRPPQQLSIAMQMASLREQ